MPTADLSPDLDAFIARWRASSAAERANYVLFLSELCTVLDLERPNPQTSDPALDAYVFEKPLPLPHGTVGRIDLYKRGCFVLEAKQGSDALPNPDRQGGERGDPSLTVGVRTGRSTPRRRGTAVRNTSTWDVAMERARRQAETYARSLPPAEVAGGRPPFLVVIDVGATFEFYSEFTRSGGNYIPFPDPGRHRVTLEDLRRPEVRELLAAVWHDPLSLDPARRSAAVTRAISTQLAALARSLEAAHPPDAVAHFLMRCLFTMFAEDVGLLPVGSFTELLDVAHADPASFAPLAAELWRTMKRGGYSVALRRQVAHFNGKLFADADALPLNAEQVALLAAAARADWRDVEPAIFGTLLERALDPRERHKLGAHYTPRAYVERLVWPTVIAPLRQEWDNVKAAALIFQQNGQERLAIQVVADFQQRLARLRVLDPACGTANFLYVTLEHLKRLEAEVLELLRELGHGQLPLELEGVTVTPAQFLGIEVNPRAAAIAELVLWIGYLQWHYRAERDAPLRQPILADQPAIDCRDAVLAWDGTTPQLDDAGQPVTRWDGRTFKRHPVTGEWMPDEHARTPVDRYLNPRPAAWPAADFIVGNPPYIGAARMRELLGDGYAEAIRSVYPNVPAAADYVMYWWDKAAALVRGGQVQRFGFITTNSLRQVYDRRVIEHHLSAEPPLSLLFAIPDHPWVDAADGAAVRVAMTTGVAGSQAGILSTVVREEAGEDDAVELDLSVTHGRISADLRIGADVAGAAALLANSNLSSRGMQLFGAGFIVTPEEAARLGYGQDPAVAQVIKPYRNGRDLMQTPRAVLVIDLFGLSEDEVRSRYPAIYQWVYERVKPERDVNRRASYRDRWWIHGEARANLRPALAGLPRYIATVETAKHRVFVFLDQAILPDNKLVAIALDDAWFLGVLSSRIHVTWALAAGSRLGVGNDPVYVKTTCFEKFPFPAADAAQQAHIRALAEQLDAHRKRQQALHPGLTLTDMYNVLEKVRGMGNAERGMGNAERGMGNAERGMGNADAPSPLAPRNSQLSANERTIHEHALLTVLRQLHDELDAAVAAAYGWPADLPDDAILQRLVDLNVQRAAAEAQGVIRWLRPAYQAPRAGLAAPVQAALVEEEAASTPPVATAALPWPEAMPAQAAAVRAVLAQAPRPLSAVEVAAAFAGPAGKRSARVAELLETLAALGQAAAVEDGRYAAG
jgi:hypothetical protein